MIRLSRAAVIFYVLLGTTAGFAFGILSASPALVFGP